MARPLDSTDANTATDDVAEQATARIDRAAARAFAAAVSALIISTLVVSQSSAAINPDGTVAGNSFASGTVSLVDDDQGRSLVNLEDMAPGRPIEECISVAYEGTILPVGLTLDAQTVGDLGPYLDVEIESGAGGGFGDCEGFTPTERIFDGTLARLDDAGVIALGSIYNSGEAIVYRFRFELRDESEAVGRQSSLDFVWEATP
jgi:hypothetical protein